MNESTKTKKALRGSLFALFLCIVLLIGTTFAWFTDTASTGVNKIQSGNLKVDIVKADDETTSLKGQNMSFVNKDGSADILWEPGVTFKTPAFKIKNAGNLALKYKLTLNGVTGDSELLDVIKFSVVGENEVAIDLDTFEGELKNGELSGALYIQGHMDEAAGNEYQGKSLEGLSLTVVATQDTVENDSFNNEYDKNATYPVASASELKTALTTGGIISVTKDIETNNITDTADARMVIANPTTLNLDKKIISPNDMGNNSNNFCALYVKADTTINAGKDGGVNTGTNGGYGINVMNGATLTINGGYYYGGGTAVQVQKGTVTINGGTFACEPYVNPENGYNFVINCIDSAYKDGTAKVIIKGGTFINFNPANCKAEGAGTNFVADGYKVVEEAHGSDTWYKVVKE
ncbi:MAG: SipW-dependent-type signal peptide-containing protein [Eubacteriales bacterium]|nr:SipW-dependent-type signal peptide-containing protein [Eubacteriales bacterium]